MLKNDEFGVYFGVCDARIIEQMTSASVWNEWRATTLILLNIHAPRYTWKAKPHILCQGSTDQLKLCNR